MCLLRECTGVTLYLLHLPLFFSVLDKSYESTGFIVFSICFVIIKSASIAFCLFIVDSTQS